MLARCIPSGSLGLLPVDSPSCSLVLACVCRCFPSGLMAAATDEPEPVQADGACSVKAEDEMEECDFSLDEPHGLGTERGT